MTDIFQHESLEVAIPLEKLESMLADIRDMFPVPERGSRLESFWGYAMSSCEYIPKYVKECVEKMQAENANILRASLYTADLTTQALETISDQAIEIASLKADAVRYRFIRAVPDDSIQNPLLSVDISRWEYNSGNSVRLVQADALIDKLMADTL